MTNNPNLQSLFSRGYTVLYTGVVHQQRAILDEIHSTFSREDKKEAFERTERKLSFCTSAQSSFDLSPEMVRLNLESNLAVLGLKLQENMAYPVSYQSIYKLQTVDFTKQAVIYQEKANSLTSKNFLDVVGYALGAAFQLGFPVEIAQQAVTGLKVLQRITSDEPQNNLKEMALAVEVISEVGKALTSDEIEKKQLNFTSLTVGLVVDFLCER